MSDWSRYDVPALWGELRRRPVETGWAQWAAWQKMSDLLADQANRMMGYQVDMEAAWPPSGTAAGHFHQRLAHLIEALRYNSMSAGRIGAALAQVNSASMAVTETIRQLNDQWQAASGSGQAGAGRGGAVWAVRRRELNERAYAAMNEYEATVVEASKNFIPPEGMGVYSEPGPGETNRLSSEGGGPDGPSAVGPAGPGSGTGIADPAGLGGGAAGPGGLSGGDTGLAGTPIGLPPIDAPAPAAGPPSGLAPVQHPIVPMPVGSGTPGSGRVVTPPASTGRQPTGIPGPPRRAMPVGGVIGGQPSANPPRSGTSTGRGPLPAGGVIGDRRSSHPYGSSPAAGGTGRPRAGVPVQGRRPGRNEEYRDPSIGSQWTVAEGGPAVIESRPEPEHHPGPGVIGIDR